MTVRLTNAEKEMITTISTKWANRVGLKPSDKARLKKLATIYTRRFLMSAKNDSVDYQIIDSFCESQATRICKKIEYYAIIRDEYYDFDMMEALIKIDGLKNARSRLAVQLKKYGGYDKKGAKETADALSRYGRFQF